MSGFSGGGLSIATLIAASTILNGPTTTAPSLKLGLDTDTVARVAIGLNSTDVARFSAGPGGASLRDAFIEYAGAGSWRFGAPDAAAPVAQTLSVQNVVTGTANTAGANWTFKAAQSTGTGTPGGFAFQTGFAAAAGASTVNALATVLTLGPSSLLGSRTTAVMQTNATWNTSGVARGAEHVFVVTAAAAGSTVARWLGGAAGTTVLASLSSIGDFTFGTAAGALRVQNAFTDASNGSWGTMNFADVANVLTIGTKSNGSGIGVPTKMSFVIEGVNKLDIGVTYANAWYMRGATMHMESGIIVDSGNIQVPSSAGFFWSNGTKLNTSADGVILALNNASSGFTALLLGPSGTAYPRLAPTGAGGVLQVKLADASANAQLYAATLRTDQTTVANLPAAATAGAGATAFATDANATFTLGLGLTVVGGGANKVPVYSDGTNWIIG